MEIRALKPYFIVIGLLLLTSLALAYTVDVKLTDEAGIKMYLPDRVGPWVGHEVRYCQNPACQKEFLIDQLPDPASCPNCRLPLFSMSKAEKDLLPNDTVMLKKRYMDPVGQAIHVSIVLSGRERASIHRPQVCLRGQGRIILKEYEMPIPLPGRAPLDVMVLDLTHKIPVSPDRTQDFLSYYAYWFVGKNRETASHWKRMFWMGSDRILHNVSHRWAYISVGGGRQDGSNHYQNEIKTFVGELYPAMVLN